MSPDNYYHSPARQKSGPIHRGMEVSNPADDYLDGDSQTEESILRNRARHYSSFAFPVIAGTLGPVASAFGICAMIRPWRIGEVSTSAEIQEPKPLLPINAVLVVIALVANVILLRNMVRKVRATVAQLITAASWYIASFGLVAIIVVTSKSSPAHSDEMWSQAYYYSIFAATIYFLVASMLLFNIITTRRYRYSHGVHFSHALRTLMCHSIEFLLFIFLGALVFSRIEGWTYLDAVYWADATLLTIGLGDLHPDTTLGRALLFPYTILGIISLGLTLSSIRRLVLDRYAKAQHARKLTSMRDKLFKKLEEKGELSAAEDEQLRQAYNHFRNLQSKVRIHQRWLAFATSLGIWLVLWLGGAGIFMTCEQPYQEWTYFEAVYFSFTSLLTVGYGDMAPATPCGRSFFVLWTLLAVPTISILVSNAEETVISIIRGIVSFIGKLSVLPSEQGFRADLRRVLSMFPFYGGHQPAAPQKPVHTLQVEVMSLSRQEYLSVLMDEIINVIRHLKERPTEQFPFDQWLWYWKLVHRYDTEMREQIKSTPQLPRMEEPSCVPTAGESSGAIPPYSSKDGIWNGGSIRHRKFGFKSPLIGPREECEWILDRLTETMKRELNS